MKNKISVVKIGGSIINNTSFLNELISDFIAINQAKIIIHGGGSIVSEMNEKLGIKNRLNKGRRITTSEVLDTAIMVYSGNINKNIVSKLQAKNCNALGLTGCDANTILAKKRSNKPIDFGYVGNVKQVNSNSIKCFIDLGITPVFCSITHDGNGQLFNTNADTIASEIAISMTNHYDVELIYCSNKKGVLQNPKDDDSLIHCITTKKYLELLENQIITDGMLPKLQNCFNALNNKVGKVSITNYQGLKYNNKVTKIML
tara:strand:+ start:656 stop:1432 length:777 start_codon:yes stop_codon:yes gene_type:complete